MVQQSFLQCGISGNPDGSDIDKIRIKDIPNEKISWDGWDNFNCDAYMKKEMTQEEISDVNVDNDCQEYISLAEDVQQPIGNSSMRPWEI
ncbi:uncharacterized protein LY79DRAFT_547266 [Colletotrichum navitas]|uniref:Uncharacterized protein n=1 Tax=Colletotrichum navitas TaxID=681940 RepID=A0AAD8Q3R2_9PEZI|nr:uncharacterized protein LY79DRAFT_547266 [Colletotrichum navitas]KAK1595290.1 hypothetical protein LY79DRAFT_547266 [Colletotrichum navitas]